MVFDIAIIGRGTSAAMYLRTLTGARSMKIIAIGKDNPWNGARGHHPAHYTKNINQALQLVNFGLGNLALRDQVPVDRLGFGGTADALIKYYTNDNVLDATVEEVFENDRVGYFQIVTADPQRYIYARKVVVAAGAGIEENRREYHQVPGFVGQLHRTHPHLVMDLDAFQRCLGYNGMGTRKIAVFGANAGTDAIMEAATRNFRRQDVYWMLRPDDTPGTALTWDVSQAGIPSTFSAAEAGNDRGANGCVERFDDKSLTLAITGSSGNERVRLTYTKPGHGAQTLDVRYVVYAMGQFGTAAKGSHSGFLPKSLVDRLEPIYDVDQRYGEGSWSHVVGVQLTGTGKKRGLEIVGSAASQIGRVVKHNFLDADYDLARQACADPTLQGLILAECPALLDLTNHRFSTMCTNAAQLWAKRHDYYVAYYCTASRAERAKLSKTQLDRLEHLYYLFTQRVKAAAHYQTLGDSRPNALLNLDGEGASMPATIGDNRLIGGLQRNISGVNRHVNINHARNGVNFMEDRTTIAIHVAINYPHIPEGYANELVEGIVAERSDKLRGFDRADFARIEERLRRANTLHDPNRRPSYIS